MRLRILFALLAVIASAAFGLAAQKGLDGAEDFEAAAGALDQNSVELSEAIGSVYGDEAAGQFLDGPSLWRDHISFFVDYTVALATDDEAGTAAGEYEESYALFREAYKHMVATGDTLAMGIVQQNPDMFGR